MKTDITILIQNKYTYDTFRTTGLSSKNLESPAWGV